MRGAMARGSGSRGEGGGGVGRGWLGRLEEDDGGLEMELDERETVEWTEDDIRA